MARNGSGTYTNPYPNFVSGTVISSTEVDANNSQIATALTQSIAVDGQAVVTADIPLATHKFTAMKVGTAATDSLTLGQAQAEAFVWCGTATGSADAIVLTPSPPITAYAAGQRFVWMASSLTNTTATTVAISGLSAIALQDNGDALTAGQHAASKMFMGILNTTSTVQIMQVQVSGTDPLIVTSLTVTGDATIGDDLTLLSDAAVLGFGVDTDVTLTHVHDTGLLLNSTMALQFNNASQYINAPTATVLDINATDEIELNATTIDVNGAVNFAADATYAAGADIITASLGANNVRIGAAAGDSIILGGDNNVVVGTDAGTSITTGSYNTAVGYSALTANTTANSNTAVGVSALEANTTGANNTALGRNALNLNTTASSNTAVGYSALEANTTGANNTAFGRSALGANTTADNNVSVGRDALGVNTTGASNVAVGYSALGANTTGPYNVAMGYSALGANTTGAYNAAIGYGALADNTTANSNTAVGYGALADNTTGTSNTAVGTSVLSVNTTGAYNTAVGYSALISNTTASYNTAVGYWALNANTTGPYNVAIGYRAGYGATTATQLTTGTGNVFLGYRASGTVATQDYGTAIGYSVAGAAGYTTVGQGSSDIRAAHGVATWATVSDERYKKDIADSTAGLAFVNALRPRTFKYRTLGELPETFTAYESGSTEVFKNSDTNHGFIAQEVKAAIDADSSIKDGFRLWDDREDGSQEVAEAALIPVLTKAIQELSAQVTALTARLAILEG